jgi:hypothetical protein
LVTMSATSQTTFTDTPQIGIGVNSITVATGTLGTSNISFVGSSTTLGLGVQYTASVNLAPFIGVNVITALESSNASAAVSTFNGTESNMKLFAQWRG